MDRYDQVIRDVIDKTRSEAVKWLAVQPSHYSDVVLNSHRVLRAYLADYDLGGQHYEALFLEKKEDKYDGGFDEYHETRDFELLILQDKRIVLSLIDGLVERDDLLELASTLRAHNDQTREFFAAFQRSKTP